MEAGFKAAANFYKRAPRQLGHKATVVQLYRHCLKAVVSWGVDRDLINREASRIRGLFEENRHAAPDVATRLIREAGEKLVEYTHPDKYVVPYMPGGSKFMRNAPPPLEVRGHALIAEECQCRCRLIPTMHQNGCSRMAACPCGRDVGCDGGGGEVVVVSGGGGGGGVIRHRVCSMVQVVFPHGIPEDIKEHEEPVHPDQILLRFRPENDLILIDAMAKKMV